LCQPPNLSRPAARQYIAGIGCDHRHQLFVGQIEIFLLARKPGDLDLA